MTNLFFIKLASLFNFSKITIVRTHIPKLYFKGQVAGTGFLFSATLYNNVVYNSIYQSGKNFH